MSMERLTDKIITKACNDPWDLCELDSVCKRDCYKPTPCKIPHVVYRLAQIEDINRRYIRPLPDPGTCGSRQGRAVFCVRYEDWMRSVLHSKI